MLDPDFAFLAGNLLVLPLWLLLIASLFAPKLRPLAFLPTRFALPALFALAYGLLIFEGFREAEGGSFSSIVGVRTLFASDAALAAGWLHYLAFDLFVGSWEVEVSAGSRVPALLVVPCLVLTLLAGPLGLLLYLLLRLASGTRRPSREIVQ